RPTGFGAGVRGGQARRRGLPDLAGAADDLPGVRRTPSGTAPGRNIVPPGRRQQPRQSEDGDLLYEPAAAVRAAPRLWSAVCPRPRLLRDYLYLADRLRLRRREGGRLPSPDPDPPGSRSRHRRGGYRARHTPRRRASVAASG